MSSSDYAALAESLKEQGNASMAEGDAAHAVELYSQAIGLDPDNHIYYSNRSAAYMKTNSISKALRDAEQCVALAPLWTKSFSRLGAAQQALGRFDAAIASFQKGIELEPSNKLLWAALRSAQEAKEAMRLQEARSESARATTATSTEASSHSSFEAVSATAVNSATASEDPGKAPSASADDDLASFFEEVAQSAAVVTSGRQGSAGEPLSGEEGVTAPALKDESILTEKYTSQDLGDSASQLARLTAPNYAWRNLNPFEVLQLDIDATLEDIKYRYRKLSSRVHPDKLRDAPLAREAFEEVKTAYQRLLDPQQRDVVVMNIQYVRDEAKRERQRLLNKGVNEGSLPPLDEEIRKRTMKHFADIELQRRKSEKNIHAHNARERMKEEEEREKAAKVETFDKEWAENDRREKRVGNWREFTGLGSVADDSSVPDGLQPHGITASSSSASTSGAVKRPRLATAQREERAAASGSAPKYGVVELESWKKHWK